MASVIITGDTSGSITLSAPTVSGSSTQTLVAVTGTLAPIVSGTTIATTSGATANFTGIPDWVKRITVMFNGVSTNSTLVPLLQLGTSGGIATTGYVSASQSSGQSQGPVTNGWTLITSNLAANTLYGVFTLAHLGSNVWVGSGNIYCNGSVISSNAGGCTLSGVLTTVSINSQATFDAGSVNILYE